MIPAVTNAVYDAVGVRIDETPITPEKVVKAMDAKRRGQPARLGPERLPVFTFPAPKIVESAFGQPAEGIAERPFASQTPHPTLAPHPTLSPEGRG